MGIGSSVADRAVVDENVDCPRCGYDLRLLTVPRCPECGLPFAWEQIVASARLRHATPLFEYHWRTRPFRSLLGTAARTLYPPALWRCVPIMLAPRPAPLLVLAFVVGLGTAVVDGVVGYWVFYYFNRLVPTSMVPRVAGELAVLAGLGLLIWLGLLLFWNTRSRGGLHGAHLLRVIVLAWTGFVMWRWLVLTAFEISATGYHYLTRQMLYLTWWPLVRWTPHLAEGGAIAVLVWSLSLGLRRYVGAAAAVCLAGLTTVLAATVLAVSMVGIGVYVYDSLDNPWTRFLQEARPATANWIGEVVLWLLAR